MVKVRLQLGHKSGGALNSEMLISQKPSLLLRIQWQSLKQQAMIAATFAHSDTTCKTYQKTRRKEQTTTHSRNNKAQTSNPRTRRATAILGEKDDKNASRPTPYTLEPKWLRRDLSSYVRIPLRT